MIIINLLITVISSSNRANKNMTMFIVEMLSSLWRCLTGLFGCLQPTDDYKFRRLDESNYIDKVARVLPKKPNKCDKDAHQIFSFSTKLDKLRGMETMQELMSSYCEILKEISDSSILIACSLALSNAQFLREKCKELQLRKRDKKALSQLDSSISLLEMNLPKLSREQDASFSFWPHGSLRINKEHKLDTMHGIIKLLQLELLSSSHLIRFLTNKKRGRGQRLSLDLHGCNPAHAWHLASSAMDKMTVGEEMEMITGNGVDSKNKTGPRYNTIREDFLEKFEIYNRERRMAYKNLGHPPKPNNFEELNKGLFVVKRVR